MRVLFQEGFSEAFYDFVRFLLFAYVTTHCAYTRAFFVNHDHEQFVASASIQHISGNKNRMSSSCIARLGCC